MTSNEVIQHPDDSCLRDDALPFVWCPGCGIGTVINAFLRSVEEATLDSDKVAVVSGFGCTAPIADCLTMRTHNIQDGYVYRYGARIADENPGMKVVVFSNNTDLFLTGAQDFIEMRRHNSNLLVIHVNNFFYIVTEQGLIPTSPLIRTSKVDFADVPYNIPHMAKSCGATFVARWTPFHAGWLKYSILDALSGQGLSVIEVVSPCLLYYANERRIGNAAERMKFYSDNTVISTKIPMEDLDIRAYRNIIVGKFLDLR